MFENPQREIVNVITKSDFTPTDADLLQLAKAVRSQMLNYAQDTGSDSALNVALDPPLTSYTKGLVLHVRVLHTNSHDNVTINAGAGNKPVLKMSGAAVGAEQLPANALITLIYDGTNFQLSNFGGAAAGGPAEVFRVNIPYAIDESTTPGQVRVTFPPQFGFDVEPSAGEIIAVKISNTNPAVPRALMLHINTLTPREMLPNGGYGESALQGDVRTGDIMIIFYDGSNWWFTPNPEINDVCVYPVGPTGQLFTTVEAGINAIKRKTIGKGGRIIFQLLAQEYGPIVVNHPQGDNIEIRGTMNGAGPSVTGIPPMIHGITVSTNEAMDAVTNLAYLNNQYGTRIRLTNTGGSTLLTGHHDRGITNTGPGMITVRDLCIVGDRLPELAGSTNWKQAGIHAAGGGISCVNVSVWGAQIGFIGQFHCNSCFAIHNSRYGFNVGGNGGVTRCGAVRNLIGCAIGGAGTMYITYSISAWNSSMGAASLEGAGVLIKWSTVAYNGYLDLWAVSRALLTTVLPGTYGTVSPPYFVLGNGNATTTTTSETPI